MEFMSLKEARCVTELYPSLSLRDRLTILARLIFCISPIVKILDQYIPERGLIMDVGCGYGIISHLLSSACPGRSVIGIDMSSHRIEVAKSGVDQRGAVEFHTADIREFQIQPCNAVVMIDVLYMLSYRDQERLLTQCYESLCDNGVVLVKDNSKSPYWKYAYAYVEDVIKTRLRIYGKEVTENLSRYWDIQEFLKLLNGIGFSATAMPFKSYLPYPGVFYVCRKKRKRKEHGAES
jgi:2-polyprenyl-3-methyl-5-hydroxy-6-metoxy-1,4-benzoquinol methylase